MARFFGWHKNIREKTAQVEDLYMPKDFQAFLVAAMTARASAGPYNCPERDAKVGDMLLDSGIKGLLETMQLQAPQTTQGFMEMAQDFVTRPVHRPFPKSSSRSRSSTASSPRPPKCHRMSERCPSMRW